MNTWHPVATCPTDTLEKLGITDVIKQKFHGTILDEEGINLPISLTNLYYDDQLLSWSHPLVYFDTETNFEFRFTAFQGDWSDDSQFNRFSDSYRQHLEQSLIQKSVNPLA
jgi:hypothetical protein